MSLISLRDFLAQNSSDSVNTGRTKPPATFKEWQAEYDLREARYNGEGYSDAEIKALGLFLALDDDGNKIGRVRQLTRDVQHVVDVGAGILEAGARPGLKDVEEVEAERLQEHAGRIWRRSRMADRIRVLADGVCKLGRYGIEVMNTGRGTVLVPVDARRYRVTYDETGTRPVRVEVSLPFYDSGRMNESGEVIASGKLNSYVRILDEESVRTYLNGKEVKDQTGDHGLDVVPFVNLQFKPYGDSEHGLHAFHGLDSPLAMYDSLFAQAHAVGARYGNPTLVVKGAKVGAGSKLSRFGRVISGVPTAAEVAYLEASLSGLTALLDAADRARLTARETLPEFVYAGAGSGESGEALRYRAGALTLKYRSVRAGFYGEIARALDIAARYDDDEAYIEDVDRFEVSGDSFIPADVLADLEALERADGIGLTAEDKARGLQRLGYADPDVSPQEYAAAVAAERESIFRLPGTGSNGEG